MRCQLALSLGYTHAGIDGCRRLRNGQGEMEERR